MPVKMLRTFAIEWAPASYHRTAAGGQPTRGWQALGALCTISWWMLLGAATVGGRRLISSANGGEQRGRATQARRFVLAAVFTVAMTHAVFISDDRYHLPVVPLLCVLLAGLAVKPGATS